MMAKLVKEAYEPPTFAPTSGVHPNYQPLADFTLKDSEPLYRVTFLSKNYPFAKVKNVINLQSRVKPRGLTFISPSQLKCVCRSYRL